MRWQRGLRRCSAWRSPYDYGVGDSVTVRIPNALDPVILSCRAPHLENVVDDLQVLDDVVCCVDEEAGGHAVVRALVLGPRVDLHRANTS